MSQNTWALSSRKTYLNSATRSSGFFLDKKWAIALILTWVWWCGGWGWANTTSTPRTIPTPWISTPPIETLPTLSTAFIELWPISGGSVVFRTLSGKILSSGGTSSDGSLSYNPREIVSQMSSEEWIVAHISGWYDTDKDDDGVTDTTPTQIRGSFRMLIHRSALISGEKIVVNPRAGAVSDTLLSRDTLSISQEALDHIARQTGADDQNNDSIINYRDITSIRTKDITGISKVIPAISGYISSIHSGDEAKKMIALTNIAKTENHILPKIIASANPDDHTPALELTTSSPTSTILYTLDGSSPLPNGPTTKTAMNKLTIPFQSAKLYYREQFSLSGKTVLGKVVGFDLTSDWTELAQTSTSYNNSGKENAIVENLSYKNVPYTLTSISNGISSAYTYPKSITCSVWQKKDATCNSGPYLVWSGEHEVRVRGLIETAVKSYIDTPTVIIGTTPIPLIGTPSAPPVAPPTNLLVTIRDKVVYKWDTYTITNTWTAGPNTTKIFPVRIDVTISWKNGQTYSTTHTVNTEADRLFFNTQLEKSVKEYIDSNNTTAVPPTYSQNHSISYTTRMNNYYGGFYEVFNTYNLDGKSDYPVQISGIYGVQNQWTKTPSLVMATNEAERVQKSNQMVSDIRKIIQAWYTPRVLPTFSQNYLIDSGFISYRNGYGYNILTKMNTTGTSDYPASVSVRYTTPLSQNNTTASIATHNASELAKVQTERVNDAKARIDLILSADVYAPNTTEQITGMTSYGWGSYKSIFTYSGNPGQDYPGYIDTYITYRNGSSDTLTIQADNANQKTTYASNLEGQARLQIDNYNPIYSVNYTGSDGPYSYGNKWSEYTFKVKYNRVGTNANYPALVWIEYKSRSTGQLLDTRTTYGNMIANSSIERDQMKSTLAQWVKWQIVATGPESSDKTVFATNWKLYNLLPLSSAHAVTNSTGIYVKPAGTQLPGFSYLDADTVYGKFLGNNDTIVDHFVRRNIWKGSMGDTNLEALKQKYLEDTNKKIYLAIKSELAKKTMKICMWQWITLWNCVDQSYDPRLPIASSQSAGMRFQIADALFWRNWPNQMNEFIDELLKYSNNFLIMYAIIFEEQAHLRPPYYEDSIVQWVKSNDTVGLSQIQIQPHQSDKTNFGYTDSTRDELLNSKSHLAIMNDRINKIRWVLKKLGQAEAAENIGRAWNGWYNCINWSNLCPPEALAYWTRVKEYAESMGIYYQKFTNK